MSSLVRTPACTVKFCPAPRDPDFHRCWCGQDKIEHHHVESRGMGGSKLKRHVVALCHPHHEAVTLHECYDIVTEFAWGTSYSYFAANGDELHTRTLEAGSAAAEGACSSREERLVDNQEYVGSNPTRPLNSAAAPSTSGREEVMPDARRDRIHGCQESNDQRVEEGVEAGCESRAAEASEGSGLTDGDSNLLDGTTVSPRPSAAPPSLEAWCREGMELVYMGLAFRDATDGLRFAIGDWFNKGEGFLSEQVYGYLRGFEDVTVRQYSWVAGRVALDTRVSKLPWTYHRAVAALPEPEQKEWLQKAQEENLTSKELNRVVHGEKPKVKRWSLEELRYIARQWVITHESDVHLFLDWLEEK